MRKPAEEATLLSDLVNWAEEKLQETATESANRAINVSCSVGLIPAGLIVVITYLFTKGNLVATIIISILMVVALMGFANITANISREKSVNRVYIEVIDPQINEVLEMHKINRGEFEKIASRTLPPNALIMEFINQREYSDSNKTDKDL